MSNIFKSFSGVFAEQYVFPSADEIDLSDDAFISMGEENIENREDADFENEFFEENTLDVGEFELDDELAQMIENAKKDSEHDFELVDIENKKSQITHQKALANNLEFASVQANEIIEDAIKRAKIIVDEATDKAQSLTQNAIGQVQTLQKEAFEKGYAEGFEQGQNEAAEQSALQIKEFLKAATQQTEMLYVNSQKELCDLAVTVAEKVIHVSLKSSREVIGRMIQVSTEKLKRREWVRIYINEGDAKGIAQASPTLMAALAGLSSNIKIVPLKDNEEGTCIIEMPDEIIDASVSTQLKNIQDTLNHL